MCSTCHRCVGTSLSWTNLKAFTSPTWRETKSPDAAQHHRHHMYRRSRQRLRSQRPRTRRTRGMHWVSGCSVPRHVGYITRYGGCHQLSHSSSGFFEAIGFFIEDLGVRVGCFETVVDLAPGFVVPLADSALVTADEEPTCFAASCRLRSNLDFSAALFDAASSEPAFDLR